MAALFLLAKYFVILSGAKNPFQILRVSDTKGIPRSARYDKCVWTSPEKPLLRQSQPSHQVFITRVGA